MLSFLQLSALGYLIRWDTRRKMQLYRHFNGFFGGTVGKLLILKGFFRRDNVQNGALFFFCFSLFSRWRGYVPDFVHIFWAVWCAIMVLGAGADPSLSRIAPAWAQTGRTWADPRRKMGCGRGKIAPDRTRARTRHAAPNPALI